AFPKRLGALRVYQFGNFFVRLRHFFGRQVIALGTLFELTHVALEVGIACAQFRLGALLQVGSFAVNIASLDGRPPVRAIPRLRPCFVFLRRIGLIRRSWLFFRLAGTPVRSLWMVMLWTLLVVRPGWM